MKAPAFQWYAAEYLADERVMLMSLEAEGAYVRLLSLCWREGSIPANPLLLAAMCKHADQKIIKEVVPCFTKSGAPSGRLIHKRLEEEREKQEAYRAKQSAKGLMGGRPRKADDKPEESHGKATALPQLNHGLTTVKPVKSSSASTSTSPANTADAVTHEAAAANLASENEKLTAELAGLKAGLAATPDRPTLPAKKPLRQVLADRAAAEEVQTFTPDTWEGLTNPVTFAAICKDLRLPENLDREAYRAAIQDKMRGKAMNAPASTLRSWIATFFVTERKGGALLTADAAMPTVPTPQHELPKPGQERPGQIIAIKGHHGDENMNRMAAAYYEKQFPLAQIHTILPR